MGDREKRGTPNDKEKIPLEKAKAYIIQKNTSPDRIIIRTIISGAYNILFFALIFSLNKNDYDDSSKYDSCRRLKTCNNIICIILLASFVGHLIFTTFQLYHYKEVYSEGAKKEENNPGKYVEYEDNDQVLCTLFVRFIFNLIFSAGLLIPLTIIYFTKDLDNCSSVKHVDYVFLFTEFILLLTVILSFFTIGAFFLICKGRRVRLNGKKNSNLGNNDKSKHIQNENQDNNSNNVMTNQYM